MTPKARLLLKLAVLVAVLVIVVPLMVGAWLVWKRPFLVDAWMSRLALDRVGLASRQIDGPAGPVTVWEGGDGPPMVLLHGAGDQAGAWARVMAPLVAEYRVLVPDLPGHWKSEPTEGPILVPQLVAGLGAVLDDCCRGEPAIVVGNSMGAWISFLYAVDHPERVARLVAVNGGPIKEQHPGVNLFPTNRDEARETMKGLMGPNTPMPPGFVLDDMVRWAATGPAARLAERLVRGGPELDAYVLDGRLDEVTVPVDLVWGDADGLFTMDYAGRLVDGLPAVRLTTVADCGHVPHRECPDRFLEALDGALDQPPPTPDPVPVAEPDEVEP
jgi:pimeloyl-ACP methyl ester carboxylesterase